MIICITGATGFIGRKLVDDLILGKHDIKILSRKKKFNHLPEKIKIYTGDLCDPECELELFLENCDVLIHCAAELVQENLMYDLHINGTKKLLKAVKKEYDKAKKKIHWVQLSSCGAYGPPENILLDRTITEDSKTFPILKYEITKNESDILVVNDSKLEYFTFSILRPSNVIGTGKINPTISKLIYLLKKKCFFYFGNGVTISTFVHVNDVVRALVMLSTDSRAKGEIFNLSSDCKFEDLIRHICIHINVKPPSTRLPIFLLKYPLYAISFLLRIFINIPSTDIFIARTKYPSAKIESKLDFKFAKPLPESIVDII